MSHDIQTVGYRKSSEFSNGNRDDQVAIKMNGNGGQKDWPKKKKFVVGNLFKCKSGDDSDESGGVSSARLRKCTLPPLLMLLIACLLLEWHRSGQGGEHQGASVHSARTGGRIRDQSRERSHKVRSWISFHPGRTERLLSAQGDTILGDACQGTSGRLRLDHVGLCYCQHHCVLSREESTRCKCFSGWLQLSPN